MAQSDEGIRRVDEAWKWGRAPLAAIALRSRVLPAMQNRGRRVPPNALFLVGDPLVKGLVMTTFDRREEAFEAMFAHDEEMHFRAEARRAKLLAGWALGQTGLADTNLDAYSSQLVDFVVAHPGDAALFERLRADLGGSVSDGQIHERMAATAAEALRQVKSA